MSGADDAPPSSDTGTVKRERRVRRKRVRRSGSGSGKEQPSSRWSRWLTLAGLALGAVVAALAIYLLIVYPSGAGPGPGHDVELTFEPNESLGSVVDKMVGGGLVRSPRVFSWFVRFMRPHVAPGVHLLTDDASPGELLHRIEREGEAKQAKVTIPEGWNRFDIAKRLQNLHVSWAARFVEATTDPAILREAGIDGDSAEGFLFPATYELYLDSDPGEIVRRLIGEFERRYNQLDQNHRLAKSDLENGMGWGRREIVTLASMVEKEAAVDDERPVIASVFLNRLRDPSFKRKLLQCDPTSAYGCLVMKDRIPACASFTGKVTHAINMDPQNTYSTYVHEGLPPGPIGNPGTKSLQAAMAPAATKYLYFVVRGDRRHQFSETLDEHNAAVKDLKERNAAKEGRAAVPP